MHYIMEFEDIAQHIACKVIDWMLSSAFEAASQTTIQAPFIQNSKAMLRADTDGGNGLLP